MNFDIGTILTAAAAGQLLSPATAKLLQSVGSFIGKAYEPRRIRQKGIAESEAIEGKSQAKAEAIIREAEAKADAKLILEMGTEKAAELRKRAEARVENETLRHQINREAIVQQAADVLPEDVSEEPVEADWLAEFFEQCQNVSESEMQSLWGSILAGQIAQPGRFSRRTLHAVKVLEKEDANLFTNYCKFVWSFDQGHRPWFFFSTAMVGSILAPDVMREIDQIYASEGVTPAGQFHLQALNLVSGAGHFSMEINWTMTEPAVFHYHDRTFAVFDTPERPKVPPPYGPVISADYLTDIGRELAPIAGSKPHDRYCDLIIDSLKRCPLRVERLSN